MDSIGSELVALIALKIPNLKNTKSLTAHPKSNPSWNDVSLSDGISVSICFFVFKKSKKSKTFQK
jgi:hypothetical protein